MKISSHKRKINGQKQHTVPKFILKNFSPDGRRIGVLLKRFRKPIQASINDAFCRTGRYDFRSPAGEEMSMEESLGRVESEIAPTLRRIVQEEMLNGDEAESHAISMFFALQEARSYEVLDAGIGFHHANSAVRIGEGLEKYLQNIDQESLDEHLERGATLAGGMTGNTYSISIALFRGFKFHLLSAPPGSEFLISDNPISRVFLDSRFFPMIPSTKHKNFKILVPISPRLAICGVKEPYLQNLRNYLKELKRMRSYMTLANGAPQVEFTRVRSINAVSRKIKKYEDELDVIEKSGLLEIDGRKCDAFNLDQFILAREHLGSASGDFSHFLRLLENPRETFMGEFY